MKVSKLIQELINIEKENGEEAVMTMPYIHYLRKIKKFVERGDIELTNEEC